MTFYRLRDVATPPFAYVANREAAVRACDLCMMPYYHLNEPLQVEIFTTEIDEWKRVILGQPLMAEHWLIGDASFGEAFSSIVGRDVQSEAVTIVSWLTRNKAAKHAYFDDLGSSQAVPPDLPRFFRYFAGQGVPLDADQCQTYPPIACSSCRRAIPDIPVDVLPIPQSVEDPPNLAYLQDLHLEGYDYLFPETIAKALKTKFPNMVFDPLQGEPTLF